MAAKTSYEKVKGFAIPFAIGVLVMWAGLAMYGWKSPGTVAERVAQGTEAGRLEVRASACADAFMTMPAAVAEMKGAGYNRESVLRKHMKAPDGKDLDYSLAGACSAAVAKRMEAVKP